MPRSLASVALLVAILSAAPAGAQTDMSFFLEPPRVQIDLGYAGRAVVVAGVIPRDADGVILTCESSKMPHTTMVRKERVAFFWMPTKEFRVDETPGLYLLASSKPLNELLGDEWESLADKYGIGYPALRRAWKVERLSGAEADDDMDVLFKGLVALKQREGLYQVSERGVRLEPDGLFIYHFQMPDKLTVGEKTITAYAIKDRQVIRTFRRKLEVERTGLVTWMSALAYQHSVLYGITAVLVATMAGLGAGQLFGGKRGR